jgi:hypothetical protein
VRMFSLGTLRDPLLPGRALSSLTPLRFNYKP